MKLKIKKENNLNKNKNFWKTTYTLRQKENKSWIFKSYKKIKKNIQKEKKSLMEWHLALIPGAD